MRLLAWGGLANWPFGDLQPHSFDFLAVDPPWDFSLFSEKGGNKSAQKHYRCLPIEEINAFPVADLAAPNSVMALWGTAPMMPVQLTTMRAYGFTYKTHAVWRKMTKNGKVAFGTGYLLRGSHEIVMIGTRGKPEGISKSTRSVFDGVVREHSRKPEEFFTWSEKLAPKQTNRIELFSRTDRPGWKSWGDEVGRWNAT